MTNKDVKIDDGGTAFPLVIPEPGFQYHEAGMSLRDWFAGMALQGFCSNGVDTQTHGEFYVQIAVSQAYKIADAMLKARKP